MKYKAIPKRIRVIGYELEVKQETKEQMTRNMGKNYVGYLFPHKSIAVRKDRPQQEKWHILLHEIGHEIISVIKDDAGNEEVDLNNEDIFSLLMRLFFAVLVDNKLLNCIQEEK